MAARPMLRRVLPLLCGLLLGGPALAQPANPLPAPAALRERVAAEVRDVTVVEPHLSVGGKEVRLVYRGWPATALLAAWLGPRWNATPGQEVEVRALDGFVSRIPVERFAKYRAWLVFARQDGSAFKVDNVAQHEKQVELGPYYLVWDNIGAPELLAEGGALWPYQVAQIALKPSSRLALLPAGLPAGHEDAAAQAQKFCLSCHQVNGFGGDKMPLNLALRAKQLDESAWRRWLIEPAAVKPGTAMPPLPDTLAPAEREALAIKLYTYLRALPVAQP
ncbi:cytochrome c [Roseateles sp. DAIF2]|uniref:c-type cytochrome n=1 Tax=Roseateles sp. DAIF2 TaxID=2714952 RepID=UPI0018A2D67B|nr:cytochrome c [Roseateles sp. DAIF2]QPF71844.1 cytochrome c [Roseateles sp. DAIF2]